MITRSVMVIAGAIALVWTSGCALEQQQVEQQLSNPGRIDCRTARGDLRVLQQEKATVVQQMAEGVSSIAPAGIVLGILTGTENTKISVATGDYNAMIDQRIAQIKQTCGIQ
jgi:hypothetical protein